LPGVDQPDAAPFVAQTQWPAVQQQRSATAAGCYSLLSDPEFPNYLPFYANSGGFRIQDQSGQPSGKSPPLNYLRKKLTAYE
jgi:hypothetical protein